MAEQIFKSIIIQGVKGSHGNIVDGGDGVGTMGCGDLLLQLLLLLLLQQ